MYFNSLPSSGTGQPFNMDNGSCTTPEIIHSLMTMANNQPPLSHQPLTSNNKDSTGMMSSYDSAQSYCNLSQQHQNVPKTVKSDEQSSYDEHLISDLDQQHSSSYPDQSSPSNLSTESFGSPCASPSSSIGPCSIQATRTHLIKESLKVTIQSKRLANGQLLPHVDTRGNFHDELTPEDEDRRKRRRERNKVAATKCRNKKKERTIHLMMESDTLEQTNLSLRSEIQRLEGEKQRLLDMLTYHMPACSMQQSISQSIYYNNVNTHSIMGQ